MLYLMRQISARLNEIQKQFPNCSIAIQVKSVASRGLFQRMLSTTGDDSFERITKPYPFSVCSYLEIDIHGKTFLVTEVELTKHLPIFIPEAVLIGMLPQNAQLLFEQYKGGIQL